jgi:pyridoxine kinase
VGISENFCRRLILNNIHNHQKKIALINDVTGFGRCSAAVELPIISTLRVQCCVVPTSIFSNHTGFPSFYFDDYTSKMQKYIDEWKKLELSFNGIATGFLGSAEQINIVKRFLEEFKTDKTTVVIDPVMGDYGKIYSTYTDEMCQLMKELVGYADILTPNLTEACILTDTNYHIESEDDKNSKNSQAASKSNQSDENCEISDMYANGGVGASPRKWHEKELSELAGKLMDMGPKKIVITGIPQNTYIANYCCEAGMDSFFVKTMKVGTQRSGTGDIFASIIAADAVNGVEFRSSVKKASAFIKKCIMKSIELDIPLTDGVCFEEVLHTLK